ncbi:hypothetical protein CTI12_AA630690 [Artemisia annua]|uniref:BTB domain-containing protein n=1 Tax=Artemisia annua TaxID=35608 RepID=A0A2U1K8X0_ARTAN|nr:hypothetical protein CTI12_AA630690 [Artemisia annua]
MHIVPLNGKCMVYLGEEYVNNPLISDVTFIIEGKRFYAHRIGLLASSDAFRAMFDGGYKERDAKVVQIPNIRWETFELMMRFIYTGSVEVNMGIAQDLLKAADQYLLDGLKRLCEYTMARVCQFCPPDFAGDKELLYDYTYQANGSQLTGVVYFRPIFSIRLTREDVQKGISCNRRDTVSSYAELN